MLHHFPPSLPLFDYCSHPLCFPWNLSLSLRFDTTDIWVRTFEAFPSENCWLGWQGLAVGSPPWNTMNVSDADSVLEALDLELAFSWGNPSWEALHVWLEPCYRDGLLFRSQFFLLLWLSESACPVLCPLGVACCLCAVWVVPYHTCFMYAVCISTRSAQTQTQLPDVEESCTKFLTFISKQWTCVILFSWILLENQ